MNRRPDDPILDDLQDQQPSDSGLRPETTDYLNSLAGIGTQAYLAMRDPDLPEYEDWRDSNFASDDSGNYVSREGQAYTDDQLEHMHGFLSRQAGNPFVSGLFDGPDSPIADYMVWRNQNFSNDNGPWEDEDGNLYSEQALLGMFGAKFANGQDRATPSDGAMAGQTRQTKSPEMSSEGAPDSPRPTTGLASQIPFFSQKEVPPPPAPPAPGVPPFAFDKARIRTLSLEQVAGIVFNENIDVMPGQSTAQELQEAKTAQAHAVINGDRQRGEDRPATARSYVPENRKNSIQYQQALEAARTAFQEDNLGTDPTGGRIYFNNRFEGDKTGPRVRHDREQDPYHTYGPFTVGGGKVWTVVYDEYHKKRK